MSRTSVLCAAFAAFLLLAACPAFADDDPPGRVGRISDVEGAVSFHTSEQQQWVPAPLNYPVVAGESFWTEPAARLELQVGAIEIRLDQMTALDVVALDDRSTRLSLSQGVANLHLAALPPGGVEVMTPRGPVALLAPGRYDIDAGDGAPGAPPAPLLVSVLEGKAAVSGPRSRVEILAGESASVAGDPIAVTLTEASATPFDNWALQREERERANATLTYLSPETTGYEDLEDYGRWARDPDYGAVWYPTAAAAGWAPYRYGHWAWIPPWGWTWIDDAPWGFAPFHYGRWVEIGGRWGWCPGERALRPVYAPALVAFVGGAGFGIAVATGPALPAVGWVPLAPHEVYRPAYRASVAYVRNVNITNVSRTEISNITKVTVVNNATATQYRNAHAATVVPEAAFTRAAPVQKAAVALPHEALAEARIAPSLAQLKPSPAARAGIAVPEAAAIVPHPGAPARLARPDERGAVPAAASATPLPHAPGPSPRHEDRRPESAARGPATHQEPPAHRPTRTTAAAAAKPPQPSQARKEPVVAQHGAPRPVHPVQQTRLTPTPQGWVRAPRPQAHPVAQHTPAAQHAPAPHSQPAATDRDAKDQRKPGG